MHSYHTVWLLPYQDWYTCSYTLCQAPLSHMADNCLTHLDHLISDVLSLCLPYYFRYATTPRATLPTMYSRLITKLKVPDDSISRKAFNIPSQTSKNMWCPRQDEFLYKHMYMCMCMYMCIYMYMCFSQWLTLLFVLWIVVAAVRCPLRTGSLLFLLLLLLLLLCSAYQSCSRC